MRILITFVCLSLATAIGCGLMIISATIGGPNAAFVTLLVAYAIFTVTADAIEAWVESGGGCRWHASLRHHPTTEGANRA